MKNTLRVLEHLSYINECVLIDYTSEVKFELGQLVVALRTDVDYEIADGPLVAATLESALGDLRTRSINNTDWQKGLSELSRTTRQLWRRLVDEHGQVVPGEDAGEGSSLRVGREAPESGDAGKGRVAIPIKTVADIDHPGLPELLSPKSRGTLTQGGREFLKAVLRAMDSGDGTQVPGQHSLGSLSELDSMDFLDRLGKADRKMALGIGKQRLKSLLCDLGLPEVTTADELASAHGDLQEPVRSFVARLRSSHGEVTRCRLDARFMREAEEEVKEIRWFTGDTLVGIDDVTEENLAYSLADWKEKKHKEKRQDRWMGAGILCLMFLGVMTGSDLETIFMQFASDRWDQWASLLAKVAAFALVCIVGYGVSLISRTSTDEKH